jgi:hypothetical protein
MIEAYPASVSKIHPNEYREFARHEANDLMRKMEERGWKPPSRA